MSELENKIQLKIYFDENWDNKEYILRNQKKEENEKGFYIEKEKYEWIQKAKKEYEKAQNYIIKKLVENDLI